MNAIRPWLRLGRLLNAREWSLLIAALLAIALFTAGSPYFATADNATTILRNSIELLLAALGMTLLLAMGGIDISVGVAMGVAAIVVGRLLQADTSPFIAGLSGPIAGALLGILTGAVVVLGRIPAIVGTLGLFGVYRTAVFVLLGGQWLSGLPTGLTEVMGLQIAGIPLSAVILILTYAVVWFLFRRTPFGTYLLAIGHSEEKARLSGVPVTRARMAAFVFSGALVGLAATFYIANYRNVAMTVGGSLGLDAVAAVVLGGTSILGGRCSLVGTVLGVLLLRILQNGLLLIGVPSLWQTVVTGGLLIAVLTLEVLGNRLNLAEAGWMKK